MTDSRSEVITPEKFSENVLTHINQILANEKSKLKITKIDMDKGESSTKFRIYYTLSHRGGIKIKNLLGIGYTGTSRENPDEILGSRDGDRTGKPNEALIWLDIPHSQFPKLISTLKSKLKFEEVLKDEKERSKSQLVSSDEAAALVRSSSLSSSLSIPTEPQTPDAQIKNKLTISKS